MKRPLALALLTAPLAVGLAACGPRGAPSSEAQLMLAITGSLDRTADQRTRLPDRLRKVTVWSQHPPVKAGGLSVTYDTDLRVLSWRADLTAIQEPVKAYAGGAVRAVGAWQGKTLYVITDGPLKGNLAASAGQNLTLMSSAYAAHYEPQAADLSGARP